MEQAIAEGAEGAKNSLFVGDKEKYVQEMFSGIAPRYDLMNDVLSLRQHYNWRKLAVSLANVKAGDTCLDVCTGTGDFALDLAKAVTQTGRVVASDFCEPMIRNGLHKLPTASAPVTMMVSNAEALPYSSDRFDAVTVGFGIRNVAHIDCALREMSRVAKPGGRVVILEFNRPRQKWYKPFVDFYLFRILPRIGGLFSRREAYTYLPESMKQFVSREKLESLMREAGLRDISIRDLNFGTVCIHIGTKPLRSETEARS